MTISYIVNSFNWNIRKIEFLIDQKKKKNNQKPKTRKKQHISAFGFDYIWEDIAGIAVNKSLTLFSIQLVQNFKFIYLILFRFFHSDNVLTSLLV